MHGLLNRIGVGPCIGSKASLLQVEEEVVLRGGGVGK